LDFIFLFKKFQTGIVIYLMFGEIIVIYDSMYPSKSTHPLAYPAGIDSGGIGIIIFDLPRRWTTRWMDYICLGRPGMSSLGFTYHPRYL
jgi:hypothetical protein